MQADGRTADIVSVLFVSVVDSSSNHPQGSKTCTRPRRVRMLWRRLAIPRGGAY